MNDRSALCRRWCIVPLIVVFSACPAAAQDSGARVYQEQLRAEMDQQSPEARQMAADAGGWLNFAYFTYNDVAAHRDRTLREYDLRIWASANADKTHRFYIRGLTSYMDWNHGDNPYHSGDDYEDPWVERAWYEFDLAGKIRAQKKAPDNDLKVKIGRDFTDIGTGLVLATPLDMAKTTVQLGKLDWMSFIGRCLPDSVNIDQSSLVRTDNNRWFWGTQLMANYQSHRPFVYFLSNQDEQDDHTAFQDYEYTSYYVGAGSKGNLILPNLKYRTELVGEWGKTSSWNSTGRDEIEAWAYDAMLEYYFRRIPTRPKVMVEFIHASGDGDRAFSSTNTIGGNRAGTEDHAFNAFGFRDTGVSLAPAISNLNIYIAGASFFPLEKNKLFRKMEVGVRSYWYQKAVDGAISDSTAQNDGYVGWEGDVFIDWRITSDLTWTIRYGGFIPGDAYGEGFQDCRNFLFTGVSYSF